MKLTTILLIAVSLQVSATGFGQLISISGKQLSLKFIFSEIQKQSGYSFFYSDKDLESAGEVNITVKNSKIIEVMDLCLANQHLTYTIIGKTVVIKQKENRADINDIQNFEISTLDISGIVTDEEGTPLVSASVIVKGTNKGTSTDSKGQFSLKQLNENAVLLISFVGFESLEVPVEKNKSLVIRLKRSEEIGETIVVGYGTKKKSENTNAVSTLSNKEITDMPATNLSQVFAGRLPGVLFRNVVGSPGDESATLLIRTTDRSQDPLLVVDGVPSSRVNLDVLDPNEIESISILKDNSATAVFGARAANGVIVVTTKRGKIGKPQFSYTSNFTWSTPTKMIKNLDAYEYAVASNEYNTNSGLGVLFSQGILDTIKNQLDPYRYANTDWIALLTGNTGFVQNHNLNIRGGNEAVKYFISGSYTNQGGMFPGIYYKRYTLQNNFDITLSRQFKAQVNIGYRYGNKHNPGSASPANAMSVAASVSPLVSPYMPNGSYGGTSTGTNPLVSISERGGYYNNSSNYLTGNGRLTWESPTIKGLSAYTNLYMEKYFYRSKDYTVPVPIFNLDPNSATGYKQVGGKGNPSVSDAVSDASYYTADAAINYKKQLGNHHIEALALVTVSESKSNSNSDKRLNLVSPGLDIIDIGSNENESTSGTRSQSGRAGYVGRVEYNYDKRLFAEASFRIDGSSKFAPGHRWGFFPGGSIGWAISREKFFAPLTSTITQLKLRGSIGLAGDDNIGSNTYYYIYRVANTGALQGGAYIFGTTFQPAFVLNNRSLPNANITWAKNRQVNLGFDAILWKGKLGISFDVYQKNRFDILRSKTYNLPGTFGINGPIQNFAKMRDKGFDLALTSEHKLHQDLSLSIHGSITYVKTSYIDWGTQSLPDYQRYEGHSTNTLVGYKSLGIFQSADEISKWQVDQDGLNNTTIKPGDIKFADLDGDNKITPTDQIWIDNYGFSPFNFGLGFDLKYKELTLSAFFNGATGGYINYSKNYVWQYIYDNSWRPGNENAKYPRIANSDNNERASDATLTKTDYIRLRNLRLSYALPDRLLRPLKLKGINIYAQAANLFTITSVLGGIDPEAPSPAVASGTGGGFYPNQKNIGFGLNVIF